AHARGEEGPAQSRSQDDARGAREDHAIVRLAALLLDPRASESWFAQRRAAEVLRGGRDRDQERSAGRVEDVPSLARGSRPRAVPVVEVRGRGFQLLSEDSEGRY